MPSLRRISGLAVAIVLLTSSCTDDDSSSAGGRPTETSGRGTLAPALTEDYPCGYGFWTSNADQTVSLEIESTDYAAARERGIAVSSSLVSGPWDAVVRVGTDLMANWCDDVVDAGEPEREVTEEWEVTDGTIELDMPSRPAECCGTVTATVSGLRATTAEGGAIDLPTIEISNEEWGNIVG